MHDCINDEFSLILGGKDRNGDEDTDDEDDSIDNGDKDFITSDGAKMLKRL